MIIRCLSCGHIIDLNDSYSNYLREEKSHELAHPRHGKRHIAGGAAGT